ncbi:MAG: hypothetical protein H0V86_02150 [Chloroflexia bacterium]|nr:hypothetical protein [Chloroflexia bacterium]
MPRRRRYDLGDVADRPQLDALRACDDSRTARDTSALWTGGGPTIQARLTLRDW